MVDNIQKILDHCEFLQQGCERKKRIAIMGWSPSEISFQDGRWHALQDVIDYIEQEIKENE